MSHAVALCAVIVCFARVLTAQPQITGVFNESRRVCCDTTAPGAVTLIGGFGLGPTNSEVKSTFPLATTLAGVSVRISTGRATVDAYVLAVQSDWVRVLLPGSTPPGDATVVVTYNGYVSAPRAIQILPRFFG